MAKLNIEIPEETLIEALLRIPKERRKKIIHRIQGHEESEFKWLIAKELVRISSLVYVGGDAVKDTERIYAPQDRS